MHYIAAVLDITENVGWNARRARAFGRDTLLLVVSAEHCAGCERLAEQLQEPAVRRQLAGQAYVVMVKAGDLHEGPEAAIRIGDWTLESPGFPTCWAFRIDGEELRFAGLALGPLDEDEPDADIEGLLDGSSCWVPEAAGSSAQACSGSICLPLNARNAFHADFALPLGTALSAAVASSR